MISGHVIGKTPAGSHSSRATKTTGPPSPILRSTASPSHSTRLPHVELSLRRAEDVATLGLDGGREYGSAFAKLVPCTNGRTFDDQFRAIKETQNEFGVLLTKL